MTLNGLCSKIAKKEGKKSIVKVCDIREIMRIIMDIEAQTQRKRIDGPIGVISRGVEKRMKEIQF